MSIDDDGIRIVFTASRLLGVWSLYRHGRALHRSPDMDRIARQAANLALAEADRTGEPAKVVFHCPNTGKVVTRVFEPSPAEGEGSVAG